MHSTENSAMSTEFQHLINALKSKPGVVLDCISIKMENTAPKPARGLLNSLTIMAIGQSAPQRHSLVFGQWESA